MTNQVPVVLTPADSAEIHVDKLSPQLCVWAYDIICIRDYHDKDTQVQYNQAGIVKNISIKEKTYDIYDQIMTNLERIHE